MKTLINAVDKHKQLILMLNDIFGRTQKRVIKKLKLLNI